MTTSSIPRPRGNRGAGVPTRRAKATLALGLAAMAAAAMAAFPGGASGREGDDEGSKRPPNILLIISDDQAYTDFGFMGHPIVKTPHLDKLAAESAVFPNGYVPTSLCRASLATLLTGLYGHEHCICFNDQPEGLPREAAHPFLEKAPALPRMLREAGYLSLQTGKYWEGHYERAGFTHGMTVKGRHGDDGLAIGRRTMAPILEFLDLAAAEDKPFFVWYAPMMPHDPHNAPERYEEPYRGLGLDPKVLKYYAMITWFDETVGTLMAELDRRGLRDDTLTLFVVDNGWVAPPDGERTLRFDERSKNSPFDLGLRTPIMIRFPGRVPPGRHEDLVSTIDVVPTLLEAAGLRPTPDMTGLSLLPPARGDGPLPRDAVFGELYLHTARELETPSVNLTFRWIRQGPWKLVAPADNPNAALEEHPRRIRERGSMLFNLRDDPLEERDLADDPRHAQTLAELRRRLDQWWNPPSPELRPR